MKKFVTLLLAAGLVFGAVNTASAQVNLRATGTMDFAFEGHDGLAADFPMIKRLFHVPGDNNYKMHTFNAVERLRLGLEFSASENLAGFLQLQVGNAGYGMQFGGSGTSRATGNSNWSGAINGRPNDIGIRQAYLDWMIPSTRASVRMGFQPAATPSFTFASPVVDGIGTGIVMSIPATENITVTPVWIRAVSDDRRNAYSTADDKDAIDVFGLIGQFSYDGLQIAPYALVAKIGMNSYNNPALSDDLDPLSNGWFQANNSPTYLGFGLGVEYTGFNPFRFTGDFYYARTNTKMDTALVGAGWENADARKGWYAMLGAEYAMSFGTPAIKGWYASGDKNDPDGKLASRRVPVLSPAFNATSTYFDGVYGIGQTIDVCEIGGTAGLSLQLNGLSFLENLSHDLSLTYIRGTNGPKGHLGMPGYLTTKDYLIELDVNSTYDIYQNLAAVLELGYIVEGLNERKWDKVLWADSTEFRNAWRATMNFRYSF